MKLKKNQIQFQPINKLTKSTQGGKFLNLDDSKILNQTDQLLGLEAVSDEDVGDQKNEPMKQISQEEPKGKSRGRQRIMSDVHPQMLQQQSLMIQQEDQPRRKNTEAIQQQDLPAYSKLRKQSNLSNISLVDDQSQYKTPQEGNQLGNCLNNYGRQNEANVSPEPLSLNQRFLLGERLQILSLIKQKRIECAEKIIKLKIPKLYQLYPLLEPYMKAHIFLRKITEGDQKSAIHYAHSEENFARNIDKLFPTYDLETGVIEMVPMKKILTAIVTTKNKQHKFLKKEQFQYFAEYINSLIMKSMGVMENSRLGVILEHTSIVLRKLQEFKGMTCGVKLST